MSIDNIFHALITLPVQGSDEKVVNTNVTGASLRASNLTVGILSSIIVGTPGSGSSLVVNKNALSDILTIDTTTARVIPVGIYLGVGEGYTITTTGGTPAKITFIGKGFN
jgi:hypothetical protein